MNKSPHKSRSGPEQQPSGIRGVPAARIYAALAFGLLAHVLMAIDQSDLVAYYASTGIGNDAVGFERKVAIVAAAMLLGAFLPGAARLPGAMGIWPIAAIVVVPAIAVMPLDYQYASTGILVSAVGVASLLIAFAFRSRVPRPRPLSKGFFLGLLLAFVVVLTGFVVASYGLQPGFASLETMYTVRAEFEDRAGAADPLAAYASAWLVNVFAPALTGLGVYWRKYVFALLGFGSLVIHYLAVPTKLAILLPLVVALIALYLRRRSSRLPGPAFIAVGLTALVLGVWAAFPTPGSDIFAVLVYRPVFVPLDVGMMWTEYFSQNAKALFAGSIPIADPVYDIPLPKLISSVYGTGQGNFNSHLWSDGFANLGYGGVVLVSVILGRLLAVANAWGKGRDVRASAIILLAPSISLLNNSLFTALLSGGLFLAIFLIGLLPEESSSVSPTEAESLAPAN